jgi:hypothetical protein
MRRAIFSILAGALLLLPVACGGGGGGGSGGSSTDPEYFPLMLGSVSSYVASTDEGPALTEAYFTDAVRVVLGTVCNVVEVHHYVDGELVSIDFEWYAEDADGNILLMGVETREYEDGVLTETEVAWEAGVAGAQPGTAMVARPEVGDEFQIEYAPGVAERRAEVVALDVPVQLSDGTELLCLKVQEWNDLDLDEVRFKYYADGLGLVLSEGIDGSGRVELSAVRDDVTPDFDPAAFVDEITNPLLPMTPGTTSTYEGQTDDGYQVTEVNITTGTRPILGVDCIVVEVNEYLDGEISEITVEWFAEDQAGNVWYFGEETAEFENGEVVSTAGSWEAGVDGAQPGIVMLANPRLGDAYRQEYLPGVAADVAEVVGLDVPVVLSDGSQHRCLMTREWSPLNPDEVEYKYHAPGRGLVREVNVDGTEPVDLTSCVTGGG